MGDHGHVAEGGATGTGAVERGRQLAQRPRQVDAIGGRLPGHAAVRSQPGHGAHPAIGLRAVSAVKAVHAADELCFEAIDRAPDVDQILGQSVRRDSVDGLVDECIDGVMHTVARIRDGERFHCHIVPNICSLRTHKYSRADTL